MMRPIGLQNVYAYYNKGIANDRVGNTEEVSIQAILLKTVSMLTSNGCQLVLQAIQDFSEALRLDPDHVNAAYSRAACHNRKGNFAEAIDDYNMALSKDKARTSTSPKGNIQSPAHNRKGSFLLGAEKYVKLREKQAREQLKQGLDPLGTPLSKATNGMPRNPPTRDSGTFRGRYRTDSSISAATSTSVNDESVTMMLNYGEDTSPTSNSSGPHHITSYSQKGTQSTLPAERRTDRQDVNTSNSSRASEAIMAGKNNHAYNSPPSAESGSGKAVSRESDGKTPEPTMGKTDEENRSRLASDAINSTVPSLSKPQNDRQPTDAEADSYHSQGFACRKKGDFKGAIEAYTEAIKRNPKHFKAYFNRGFAYDKVESFREAIQDYTSALRLDPTNAYAYYNRGISYDRNNDFESAIQDFSRAIEKLPSNADFYHNRGFCHRKKGNFEAAIEDYTRALERKPNHFKAVYNRAYCYERLNRLHEALKDYDTAVSIDSSNMNAFFNRASVLEKLDRLEDAIRDFDRAVELDPSNASVYNSRGLAKDRIGRKDEALEDLTQAVNIEPNNSVYRHNRGFYYRSVGFYQEAIEDFTVSYPPL